VAHPDLLPDGLPEAIANDPHFARKTSLIMLRANYGRFTNKQEAVRLEQSIGHYLEGLSAAATMALGFLNSEFEAVVQIVRANHVGVRKNHRERQAAKDRCIEEVAVRFAGRFDLYEDDETVRAIAEVIISRTPYEELADTAARSADVTH